MNNKKILAACLALIIIAIIAVSVFKVSIGTLFFAGAFLACSLMHIWMMKDGKHKH